MDLYQEIKDNGIPVLFINASYPNLDFQAVTTSDQEAEQRMIEYLFEMDHESIMGIFQVDDAQGVHRMNGFVKAYQEQPEHHPPEKYPECSHDPFQTNIQSSAVRPLGHWF